MADKKKQQPKRRWRWLWSTLFVLLIVISLGLIFNEQIKNWLISSYQPKVTRKAVKSNEKKKASYDFSKVKSLDFSTVANARWNTADIHVVGEILMPQSKIHLPIAKGVSNEVLALTAGTMRPTHVSNLLDELGEEPRLARADKLMMLATLIECYERLSTPLIFGEPERLSSYLAMITSKNDLYTDYLLMAFKNWHQDLVMQPAPDSALMWTRIFNRNRLLEAMALHDDFPTVVSDYLDEELEFLG